MPAAASRRRTAGRHAKNSRADKPPQLQSRLRLPFVANASSTGGWSPAPTFRTINGAPATGFSSTLRVMQGRIPWQTRQSLLDILQSNLRR
jgi:hypothetical protein